MAEPLTEFYAGALAAMLTVPSRLRHHRKRRGIALRTAAEEIGIGFNTLARIERGERYTDEVLMKLFAWLIEQEKSAQLTRV